MEMSIQEKIQELTERLTALKAEKAELDQRQRALENACRMRDEEVKRVRLLSIRGKGF